MEIILFDLDLTLFNSNKFKELFGKEIQKVLFISENEYQDAFNYYYQNIISSSTQFSPASFTKFLAERFNSTQQELLKVFNLRELYTECIYPDVMDSLGQLVQKYRLGIFSQGNVEFQELKLEHSRIKDLIDPTLIFIYEDKLAHLDEIPECTFVEDRYEQFIEPLLNNKKIRPIWLNRKSSLKNEKVRTIFSLEELN
jgi:FMN phosphatase YigB (HAD superfamily)